MKEIIIIILLIIILYLSHNTEGLLADYDTRVRYTAVLDEVGRQPRAVTKGASYDNKENFNLMLKDKERSNIGYGLTKYLYSQ